MNIKVIVSIIFELQHRKLKKFSNKLHIPSLNFPASAGKDLVEIMQDETFRVKDDEIRLYYQEPVRQFFRW